MRYFTKEIMLWDLEGKFLVKNGEAVSVLVNISFDTYLEGITDLHNYLKMYEFRHEEQKQIELDDISHTYDLLDSQGLKCPKSNQFCSIYVTQYGLFYEGLNLDTGELWTSRLIPHKDFAEAYEIDLSE